MNLDLLLTSAEGGVIAIGDALSALHGLQETYDMVIFCAKEYMPDRKILRKSPPRARILFAGFDDGEIQREEVLTASRAAEHASQAFLAHRKVLITCLQGRNRSALVGALAIHMLSGCGGGAAARYVKERRKAPTGPTLSNPSFMKLLENIPAKQEKPKGIVLAEAGRARQEG